jgi:hypothetical protein
MSVLIKFRHTGPFHSGASKTIDLDKVSEFRISRQRNTCELLAITPENPQPNSPYAIARRDNEYQLQDILKELQQLKKKNRDIIYEITDTEVHLVAKV